MRSPVVVDASVALKWVITEPGSDAANDLLDAGDGLMLVAPEYLIGEVGNGLRKRVGQRVLSAAEAVEALDAVMDLELEFVTGTQRWARSLQDALTWGVTTYDALYVAVALDLDAHLVTADGRLLASARAAGLPVRGLTEPPSALGASQVPRPRT
ncbi:MAG: type II toxin-antitoxin system VapC family toxin [Pseudonocardia sp.]